MRPTLTSLLAGLSLAATACGSSAITFSQLDADFAERPFELTAAEVAAQSAAPYRDLRIPEGEDARQIMRCYAPKELLADRPSLCFEFVDGAMYYRSSQRLRLPSEALDDLEALRDTGNALHGPGRTLFFVDPDKRCVVSTDARGNMSPWRAGPVVAEGSDQAARAYEEGTLCGRVEWRLRGLPRAAVTLRPSYASEGLYEIVAYDYTTDPQIHARRQQMLQATAVAPAE